eukprot:CAMPEP_0181293828 /NCGR_PEP_ID=MMETSP1101-20121128/3271_1 /TAXON_ID=46948 /ORGANISM="Rhodomonas abbreviata, Strain Caron Lab Isolate" /LENGTH=640 /DNA_ID=CAMNT_0023398437 /DNA_START=183 /DNA_END=2102 /DNA_ORIENTATION=-
MRRAGKEEAGPKDDASWNEEEKEHNKPKNAHELADFFLSRFDIDPKVRKELDRSSKQKVGEKAAERSRINVELIEPILAKKPWDRTFDQLAAVHAEISKAHCFDKIHVSPDAEFDLCKVANLEHFPTIGTAVFREGEIGDKFYVVLEGSVHIESQAKGMLVALFEGDSFGEIAVLHQTPRAATVYVEDPCKLLSVSAKDYDRRIRPFHVIEEEVKKREFRAIAAFESCDAEQLLKLVKVTTIRRFNVDTNIFKEGDDENFVMFIIKGFVEAWKQIGDGRLLYGTFGPGETLDMTNVCAGKPVSFTATACAIVDVMAVAWKDLVPPKDSGVESLIDAETMQKLLEREKRPPEGELLDDYAKNESLWQDYKNQMVSSVLWEKRWNKHQPNTPVIFNKYCQMPLRAVIGKDQTGSLSENLTSAALPPCAQDPFAAKRKNVLNRAMLGEKLMAPSELETGLAKALIRPQTGGKLRIEKRFAGERLKTKAENDSTFKSTALVVSSQPIKTIAGRLTQTPLYIKERWGSTAISEAAEQVILMNAGGEKFVRKTWGPKERDAPPHIRSTLARRGSRTSAWRPNGPPGQSGPFAAPCKPAPSWGMQKDRWVLSVKNKEERSTEQGGASDDEDPLVRPWVPAGPTMGYH